MKHPRYALTTFPKPASIDDYQRAAAELEAALSIVPGAIAVYRYGSVTAPGISDLDMLVVVDGGRPVPSVWPRLSERTRYLAMHTPALVDPGTFSKHRWFAELGSPELVWGTGLEIEQRPVPEYSEPLLAAEALTVASLKLAKLAVTGRAKVRPWLCELANVRLDLNLAHLPPEDAPAARQLAEDVHKLRDAWWTFDEPDRCRHVRHLLDSASAAIWQALEALAAQLGEPSNRRSCRLGPPWQNVTVTSGRSAGIRNARLHELSARSHRLSEARWRWTRHRLLVPQRVITLLAGAPSPPYMEFRANRDALLSKHQALIAKSPGYSGLKLGPTLAT